MANKNPNMSGLNRSGRVPGSNDLSTTLERRRLVNITSDEQYREAILRLVDIALNGNDKNAIAAIKILIERTEGKVAETININTSNGPTVSDILQRLREESDDNERTTSGDV